MALTAGSRIGPYEVTSRLGEGGMGVVFRARDVKLQRDVALKLLPDHFLDDADRLSRFQREAQVLASLNHPNIAHVYGLEESNRTRCIVMELVEGETLQERLQHGPIPVKEALSIAMEIARALEAAHERGVIHRDLKPANIKLTPDAKVKVLDFGLAKVFQHEQQPALSNSPTLVGASAAGVILGTAAYMSPEQAKGRNADRASDVWAFGCVLYEMLTGEAAFKGETIGEILGSVFKSDPDWQRLPVDLPEGIRRLLRRCLEKDRTERLKSADDARIEIKDALRAPTQQAVSAKSTRLPWMLATAGVLFVALIVLAAVFARLYFSVPQPQMIRFVVFPPENARFDSGSGGATSYNVGSISPDGKKLAFTARDSSGKVLLWVRPLDALTGQPLAGTDGATMPFWSPDSSSIGFFADGKLRKIETGGGAVQTIYTAAYPRGAAWAKDGTIIFSTASQSPLYRVPSTGGDPVAVTKLLALQRAHRYPAFLPDGNHFMYYAFGSGESGGLFIDSLSGGESRRLASSDSGAVYAKPDHLLFLRQSAVMAQPFDLRTLQFTGPAVPIAQDAGSIQAVPPFSVSENGTLVYRPGLGAENTQMAWFDRTGKLLQTVGKPGGFLSPALAPDGKRIAVHRHDGNGGDVWLVDGEVFSRLTFDASQDNSNPVWSPDDRYIAFGSFRHDRWGIYRKPSDGSGEEELLTESPYLSMPMSWSADGKYLLFYIGDPKTSQDLWILPLAGDKKPAPIVQTPLDENHGQISPDGKWVAFNSTDTGVNQIYVKRFPNGPGKWQVSTSGGMFARWRHDGRELFFMDQPDSGRMMSVDVNVTGDSIQFGSPRALFDSGYLNTNHPTNWMPYDVSPDGQRFLIPRPAAAILDPKSDSAIIVVLNWTNLLKAK